VTTVDLLETVRRIVRRCGIECIEAESIDGRAFVIPNAAGETEIACAGSYVATHNCAVSTPRPPAAPDPEGEFAPEPFHTPGIKTIVELAEFTGLAETSLIKSVVMADGEKLFLALLRGDHQLNQEILATIVGVDRLAPASPAQIRGAFGAGAGSLGPVGVAGVRILADEALRGRRNMIAGANRDDYHLRHVTPGEDFDAEFFDLRQVEEGDMHNSEPLRIEKAFSLGGALTSSASGFDLHVTDESGKEIPVRVCSCSLSIDRILWAAAEQHYDADGLILPPEIAPFDVIVTPVDYATGAQRKASEDIAAAASKAGLEALIDDRADWPGVKFKDADLIGVPWRVTIGKKLEQGIVEVVERTSKQKTDVPVDAAVEFIRTRH
jgi:prolyl-tRNA synthetase